ncbi:MAG: hypothetical protein ACYCPT_13520 [Acidimicrobiales bacterium]
MSIKFNPDFGRQLRQEMSGAVNAQMRNLTAHLQREVDTLSRASSGRPVEEIRMKLRAIFQRAGVKGNDAAVRSWAEVIAAGRRVTIQPRDIEV